jgi:hypothetical protein
MLAKTHPVYAALAEPLFCFAGKRVERIFLPLYATQSERGVTGVASSG